MLNWRLSDTTLYDFLERQAAKLFASMPQAPELPKLTLVALLLARITHYHHGFSGTFLPKDISAICVKSALFILQDDDRTNPSLAQAYKRLEVIPDFDVTFEQRGASIQDNLKELLSEFRASFPGLGSLKQFDPAARFFSDVL